MAIKKNNFNMKTLSNLFSLLFALVLVTSCTDDATKPALKATVTANEFLAPAAASYVLTATNANNVLATFKWTAPNFGFATSITYKVQMDKASGTFTAPIEIGSVNNKLEVAVKVSDMNTKLLGLGLVPEQAASIKLRVVSSINDKVAPVVSSEKTISVTPYATSFPSVWAMGAGLNGWGPWDNPDKAVEVVGISFQVNEMVARLTNGQPFRFFAQYDWNPNSYNYPFFTTVDSKFENANDDDKNLRFVGTTGWYRVTVNFNTKVVTAVAVNEPVLYMMGEALNGWGPWDATPLKQVKMTYKKPGVFEANPTFIVQSFRFFAQDNWGPTSYNYPYFSGGVDSKFENANDDDKNLKYIGNPGAYRIRVDLNDKKVTNF